MKLRFICVINDINYVTEVDNDVLSKDTSNCKTPLQCTIKILGISLATRHNSSIHQRHFTRTWVHLQINHDRPGIVQRYINNLTVNTLQKRTVYSSDITTVDHIAVTHVTYTQHSSRLYSQPSSIIQIHAVYSTLYSVSLYSYRAETISNISSKVRMSPERLKPIVAMRCYLYRRIFLIASRQYSLRLKRKRLD